MKVRNTKIITMPLKSDGTFSVMMSFGLRLAVDPDLAQPYSNSTQHLSTQVQLINFIALGSLKLLLSQGVEGCISSTGGVQVMELKIA